jgi:uncharacterized protein (TIGR02453 family)
MGIDSGKDRPMREAPHFTPRLFEFLRELKRNNNREWFQANKHRYETVIRDPMIQFVMDFAPHLEKLSRHFIADPRPTGGSIFRIYRDIRFSRDKSPYKTHAAALFFHDDAAEGVHAPCFYLHLEPDNCFAATGLWHPDSRTLVKVRGAIVKRPQAWKKAVRGLKLEGRVLSRLPHGYDPKHPLAEDLKRVDFVTSLTFSEGQVCRPRFLHDFVSACKRMSPLVQFLTRAIGLPW